MDTEKTLNNLTHLQSVLLFKDSSCLVGRREGLQLLDVPKPTLANEEPTSARFIPDLSIFLLPIFWLVKVLLASLLLCLVACALTSNIEGRSPFAFLGRANGVYANLSRRSSPLPSAGALLEVELNVRFAVKLWSHQR